MEKINETIENSPVNFLDFFNSPNNNSPNNNSPKPIKELKYQKLEEDSTKNYLSDLINEIEEKNKGENNEEFSYELVNLKNLKKISIFRKNIWSIITIDPDFRNLEIKICETPCPNCKNFTDSKIKICQFCDYKFADKKNPKFVTKYTTPGKGRKYCFGCEHYVAVRKYFCSCGYDFEKKIKGESKEDEIIDTSALNTKKKKSEKYPIYRIKNVELLIKNDIISDNYIEVLNYSKIIKRSDIFKLVNSFLEIRNEIIEFNFKLITKIAHSYKKKNLAHLKVKDLYQIGNLGLIKAINHYDENVRSDKQVIEKSISFSTYATWWIKKAINDEILNKEREIRVPLYIITAFKNFNVFYKNYIKDNNKEPTIEEIEAALNIKRKKAEGLIFAAAYKNTETIGIEDLIKSNEEIYKDGKNTSLLAFKNYIRNQFNLKLTSSIDEERLDFEKLDFEKVRFDKPVYKEIFFSHFGILNYKELSKGEMELRYGVTKPTITKIIDKTIERIRKIYKIKVDSNIKLEDHEKSEENETDNIKKINKTKYSDDSDINELFEFNRND